MNALMKVAVDFSKAKDKAVQKSKKNLKRVLKRSVEKHKPVAAGSGAKKFKEHLKKKRKKLSKTKKM